MLELYEDRHLQFSLYVVEIAFGFFDIKGSGIFLARFYGGSGRDKQEALGHCPPINMRNTV